MTIPSSQLTDTAPIGMVIDYAGTGTPNSSWLACDGAAVSRTTYADLFTALSITWGVGDGTTTFNLPDLRRKATVGEGGTGTGELGNAVGNTGGAETHALTTAELVAHTHTASGSTPSGGGVNFAMTGTSGSTATTNSTGSDTAHNNLQPSAVVRKLIKAT